MSLITEDRLRALAMINRWGGWVKRPYSVLEHTVTGARQLRDEGLPWKEFLLHDLEESEFGDIITPVKDLIPPGSIYYTRVARFNHKLHVETGIWPDGGDMDVDMAHAEHLTVAVKGDPKYDARPMTDRVKRLCAEIIMPPIGDEFWVNEWLRLWHEK
jgi:hypothetical protein